MSLLSHSICSSEIFSTCNQRNGVYLKIPVSEICTSEIRASQGPPVNTSGLENSQWH